MYSPRKLGLAGEINLIKARSVAFPPSTLPAVMVLPVLNIPDNSTSSHSPFFLLRAEKLLCSPVAADKINFSRPRGCACLSANSMFQPFDVSIPTSFRTRTLSLSILRMFEESTTVIIIGSPSGTATTTTVIARVAAWSRCSKNTEGQWVIIFNA